MQFFSVVAATQADSLAWVFEATDDGFSDDEMMERLAALVPRPRVHLTRYHGVLAPHYKYRKQIVPKNTELTLATADGEAGTGHPADSDKPVRSAKRIAWAQLLKRVFNIDITVCSRCRGNIKVISAIEDGHM